jgi:hypothetical protein
VRSARQAARLRKLRAEVRRERERGAHVV